jgi:hypothetical protein
MMPNLRGVFLLAASTLLFPCAASAQAQNMPSCTSAIQVLFDKYGMTHIPTGSTIWFTSVLKAVHTADGSAITSPIRIDVNQSRITFGGWPYVIAMPDSTVMLDPSISVPRRLWSGPEKLNVAYSPSQVSQEALFDALPYEAPEPFIPRSSGPVTWTATFAASRPDIIIDWAWGAAVYSQFGPVGTFQLKPLSGPIAQVDPQAGPPNLYANADSAGTPEAYKQYVIAGAMGSGAPQYTGARSETATVQACLGTSAPEPAVATQPYFVARPFPAAPLPAPPLPAQVTPAAYAPSSGMSAFDWIGLLGGIAGFVGATISILAYRRDRANIQIPLGSDFVVIGGKDRDDFLRARRAQIPAHKDGDIAEL